MPNRYKEFDQLKLPQIAEEVLHKWDENKTFAQSIALRTQGKPFVFFEGPPSANGMPGIHHVISRTLKDLLCRYKTMQGFLVNRKGGWDTHGLPIELGVEKLLGITKEDIGVKISVEEYNRVCRKEVLKFKDKWDEITTKMGYWVDLQNPYVTFENNYIETLWWCLKQLYDKGFLYEDVSIQPYSPAAGTGLSSHELNQPGTYKDVKDTSIVAMFKVVNDERSTFLFNDSISEDIFFLAWTTTPWTLPSNLGLTVGPNIDYVLIKTFNPYTCLPINVVLAKALASKYFKEEMLGNGFENYTPADKNIPWKVLLTFKGKDVTGCSYQQLLPSEANTLEKIRETTPDAEPFKIITGDFVTTEDGTGIVHTAPAFGADDFKAGKKNHLGILTLVDKEGRFIDGVGEFSGRFVKDYRNDPEYTDVNIDISVKLKKENRAFKVEKYEHNYPHCWRTDKPIIYYPLDAWFIKTTAVKERMIELNKTINWKPSSTGTGRFGNWLENMVDWNLSRSRFWGTPLPIWKTDKGEEEKCIGSIADLKKEIEKAKQILGEKINEGYDNRLLDLHKPYVDDIVLVSSKGEPMKRVPDLIDVWFDSGAMPYAQLGLPDASSNEFGALTTENFWKYHLLTKVSPTGGDPPTGQAGLEGAIFPADFIAEGIDQTRGWFYTLHALAVLLFDSVAYKTVVSNGFVLDKNGNKMSKRIGNVVDPFDTINKYGPDATRWYLITNAAPWDNLKFDIDCIKEVQRKFFGTLYNTYQFFALYANVDKFIYSETEIGLAKRPELDRWIISALNSLTKTVTLALDEYEPTVAFRAIEVFVDEKLSNWYVRLCRRRFWKGDYQHDKICAYQTLYVCLETIAGLIAPVAPFFSDWLFNNLNTITGRKKTHSIHLTDYPAINAGSIDKHLEERMELAQDVSSLILSLRKKVNLKVRQPLQKVLIPAIDHQLAENIRLVENIIKTETNIKEIKIIPAEENFIRKKAKANFKTLGKKLGPKMKLAAEVIQGFSDADIDAIQKKDFLLNPEYEMHTEEPVYISAEDIEVSTDKIEGYEIASKGQLTVALDIILNVSLINEGIAREFVNRVQNIRKDQNLNLTDKIFVKVSSNEEVKVSLKDFYEYICAEILAENLHFTSDLPTGTTIEVNDAKITVLVSKKKISMAIVKKVVKKTLISKPVSKPAAKKVAAKKAISVKKTATPAKKAPVKKVITKTIAAKKAVAAAKKVGVKKVVAKAAVSNKAKQPLKQIQPVAKKILAKQAFVHKTTSPKDLPVIKKTPPNKITEQARTVKSAPVKTGVQAISKPKEVKSSSSKPVVIPKTNTKTVKPYNPDFTKSVLDPAAQVSTGPSMRYSDSELNEFRELIQKKLDTAKKELGYLQGLITRKDDMGGDETDNRYMTMEDGSLSMEREQLSQMASRQITFIDHLEKATMRIENKTYGICRVTGKLIDKARLRAVPHATLSMEAKMGNVR